MYETNRSTHKYQNLDQEDIDSEWYAALREWAAMAKKTYDAPRHVEVELTYNARGGDKTLKGVFLSMGVNYPHLRFENGSHGFISYSDDGEDTRLLFEKSWDGKAGKRYKYSILDMKVKAYHFKTPVCPTCDVDMEFGMPEDFEREEFPVAAWLCPECFPGVYENGIK